MDKLKVSKDLEREYDYIKQKNTSKYGIKRRRDRK